MSIVRALKVMLHPPVGTAIYMGILVAQGIVQFVFIDPQPLMKAGAFMLVILFMALGSKLFMGAVIGGYFASAVFGGYEGYLGDALPRGLKRILSPVLSAVCGLSLAGSVGDAPPRGTMLLLALVLFAGAMVLAVPLLDEYAG